MNNKKSIYNILCSVGGQAITLVIGLIIPRFLLLNYGSETNGFLSTVTQIMSYMTLLEAGVGTASMQALYKPFAEDNQKSISQILSATNKYYRRTGIIYAVIIAVVSLVYPLVVNGELDYFTMVAIIVVNGATGVVSYLFQGKYKVLLQAEGKNYIVVNLNTIVNVLINVARVILINASVNIVIVQFAYLVFNVLQMLYFGWYIKKNYKWLNVNEEPDYKAISQKDAVLIYQVSAMIFEHTDVIILSIMCDLEVVSVYTVYKTVFGMANTLLTNVSTGFVFRLGQAYGTKKVSFSMMFDAYETYYMAVVFAIYSLVDLFILPFMKLYTSGVNDYEYIDPLLATMFVAINLLSSGRMTSANAINFAGKFQETKNRAILESAINLITTIIGTYLWGIYGALLGTIVALLYRTNDMIIYANKHILKKNCFTTYKRWLCNLPVFIITTVFVKEIIPPIDSYFTLLLYGAMATAVIFPIYFILASILEFKVFITVKNYIISMVKTKLKRGKS